MRWFAPKRQQDTIVIETSPAYVSPSMESPRKIDYHLEGARRDEFIVDLIRHFGLLTSDFIQHRVAVEQFDISSQHNVLNRLKILTQRKEIYNLGRTASGHIVYGAHPLRGSARRHITHDLGIGRFGITLDGAVKGLQEWCCDQSTLALEFKSGERPFVPDARFVFNGFQTYLEYHTGSQDERVIVDKMRAYKRHHESVKQLSKIDPTLTTKIRVLFLCQREGDVEKIVQIISKAYGDSMLFWIGAEAEYKKGPKAIMGPMWRAGGSPQRL